MNNQFESVSVTRLANVYFDGNVTSRTITFPGGEVKTLGIMMPGEYVFSTDKAEIMEIQAGEIEWRLSGRDSWEKVSAGGEFNVPASSSFDIRVIQLADYCCSFID